MAMWSKNHILKMRENINTSAETLSDEQALDTPELLPNWKTGTYYEIGVRVRYPDSESEINWKLYKCVQSHTSQSDWTPNVTPALWTEVAEPGEIPVWKQPTGAQDAYMTGDKVYYPAKNDAIYISTVDNNVWEPTVYGWEIE